MYHQYASGTFETVLLGPYHCGPDSEPNPRTFRFEVCVDYAEHARLTPEGFLIDNAAFQHYFDGIHATELSCELLAASAANHFARLSNNRASKVAVSMWGIVDRAAVKYEVVL